MSKREDILDNFVTYLKTIKKQDDFNTDVGLVTRDIKRWSNIREADYPYAIVAWDDWSADGTGATNQYMEVSPFVARVLGGVKSRQDVHDKLDSFLVDIENAICDNATSVLGSNTGYIVPNRIRPFFEETGEIVEFYFDFLVAYWYVYGTP